MMSQDKTILCDVCGKVIAKPQRVSSSGTLLIKAKEFINYGWGVGRWEKKTLHVCTTCQNKLKSLITGVSTTPNYKSLVIPKEHN